VNAQQVTTRHIIDGPGRHIAAVLVSESALRAVLGLPDGLRIISIIPDHCRFGLRVLVEGDSLDRVHEGAEAPIFPGAWQAADIIADGMTYRRLEWEPTP